MSAGNGSAPAMEVQARAPQMVFVGGFLLPWGSFRIEPSPLQPQIADVTILGDHPKIPAPLRKDLIALLKATAARPQDPDAPPPPPPAVLSDLRVFATLQAGGGPTLVEVQIRGCAVIGTA